MITLLLSRRQQLALLVLIVTSSVAPELAAAQSDSPFDSLIGKWNHESSGESILITPTGDVWSTAGPQARVSGAIEAGGNFAFEGRSNSGGDYRCVYYITFLVG